MCVGEAAKMVFGVHLYGKTAYLVVVLDYHNGRTTALIFGTSDEYWRLTRGWGRILEEVVRIAVVLISTM
jgi:hypothetical protein